MSQLPYLLSLLVVLKLKCTSWKGSYQVPLITNTAVKSKASPSLDSWFPHPELPILTGDLKLGLRDYSGANDITKEKAFQKSQIKWQTARHGTVFGPWPPDQDPRTQGATDHHTLPCPLFLLLFITILSLLFKTLLNKILKIPFPNNVILDTRD